MYRSLVGDILGYLNCKKSTHLLKQNKSMRLTVTFWQTFHRTSQT